MKKLEPVKALEVDVPDKVKRYFVIFYTKYGAWEKTAGSLHTTPECAVQEFMNYSRKDAEYYTVCEVELEIPLRDEPLES